MNGDADPAARPGASSVERIVALALAAILVVLVLVKVDLTRAEAPVAGPPFDFENPLLFAQAGQCVEGSDSSTPGEASWLVVRPPGPVLRPWSGPERIPGWVSLQFLDPRTFPPYVVCDGKAAGGTSPGTPPSRPDPHVFPLNGFGMPIEASCVLRVLRPATVHWNGQTRRAFEAQLERYGQLEGPWIVYLSKDAPVLGTMKREYRSASGRTNSQTFRVVEGCR